MSTRFTNPGLEGNPHFVDLTCLEREDEQVAATLTLAYEQRTSNLIALLAARFTVVEVAGVDYDRLADQIKERLAL